MRSSSGRGRSIVQTCSSKKLAGYSKACAWTSCGNEIVTAPVSAGLVRTRIASGSAVRSCSGRLMRSKNRLTGRKQSLTLTSASFGCSSCCRTGP
jgi:hypothetical protein